jgi:hypothetical protein
MSSVSDGPKALPVGHFAGLQTIIALGTIITGHGTDRSFGEAPQI